MLERDLTHSDLLGEPEGGPETDQGPRGAGRPAAVAFGMGVAALAGLAVMAAVGGYEPSLLASDLADTTCCFPPSQM